MKPSQSGQLLDALPVASATFGSVPLSHFCRPTAAAVSIDTESWAEQEGATESKLQVVWYSSGKLTAMVLVYVAAATPSLARTARRIRCFWLSWLPRWGRSMFEKVIFVVPSG